MESLRIAILTETLPAAEMTLQPWRYLGNLAQALQGIGHDAVVVTGEQGPQVWNGIPVERHRARDDFRYASGLRRIVRSVGGHAGLFRLTATLFFSMRRAPANGPHAERLAGVFLRPLHDGRTLVRRFLDPTLAAEARLDVHHAGLYLSRILGTWPSAASQVDGFVFLWDADRARAVRAGLPTEACSFVRHPFDPFFLERGPPKLGPRLSDLLKPVERRVIFTGPPEGTRGVDDVLRLARFLPVDRPTQVVLLLRDAGYRDPAVTRSQVGPHEVLVVRAFLSREELRAAYRASHAAVFPYRFVRTALPLVVLEAVATGLPVAVTRVHPIRELETKTGLVFAKVRDPRDLARAVQQMFDEGMRAEALRKNQEWIRSSPDWPAVARTFAALVQR